MLARLLHPEAPALGLTIVLGPVYWTSVPHGSMQCHAVSRNISPLPKRERRYLEDMKSKRLRARRDLGRGC